MTAEGIKRIVRSGGTLRAMPSPGSARALSRRFGTLGAVCGATADGKLMSGCVGRGWLRYLV